MRRVGAGAAKAARGAPSARAAPAQEAVARKVRRGSFIFDFGLPFDQISHLAAFQAEKQPVNCAKPNAAWQSFGRLLSCARSMHPRPAILLLLFGGMVWSLAAAELPGWVIEAPEGVDIDLNTSIATATNGVTVRYGGVVLTAKKVTVNQNTGEAVAEGDVRVEHGGQLWSGDTARYNFKTKQISGENFRSGQVPYFVRGEALAGDQNAGVYAVGHGLMTTDDYAAPGYSIHARTVVVVPGDYIEARGATLYLGKVPVFYYPYYRRSLKRHPNFLEYTPGYRSRFGPYLLTSYNWYWNDRLDGVIHLDERVSRGVGGGPDLNLHIPRFGDASIKTYYTHDEAPGLDPAGAPIRDDRKRLLFTEQGNVTSNLTLKGRFAYQSDAFVIRDFFESEYRKNQQPSTFFEADQQWSNFSLNLLAQPRVNDFFETVERLPDVKLTGLRQQIGPTPFYYESDSSFAYLRRRFATGSTNLDFEAWRGDTFHQVTLPWTFSNWLNVTPRAGGRFTHYGEASGAGATTEEQDRAVFNTGGEVSFKASRLWPGAKSSFWEIDGVRHIIEPSVNYVYVPRPSRSPRQLPQFDYEVPPRRLLPIEFPDYNSIDSIDSQNVLRLALRNKLQTKRKEGVENFVNWALYTDWRLRPRPDQGTFADAFSDLDLRPFSWMTLNSETRYDLDDKRWREANHTATLNPNDTWSVTLGHRYLRDDPSLGTNSGNNLIFTSIYFKFNENWGARASHHFEARDGTMEEQFYTLYRDFRSWTAALTLRIRDNRVGPTDYTVAITASLKAFPRYGLGKDANQPSLLIGN